MTKKRRRPIHLHVMVSEAEQALIQERMAEAGIVHRGSHQLRGFGKGLLRCAELVRQLVKVIHSSLGAGRQRRIVCQMILLQILERGSHLF